MVFKIYDVKTALETILKRVPADDLDIPPIVQERIQKTFGEVLTPSEAVQRIIADVKQHGDEALINWCQKIDHVSISSFHVESNAIHKALQQTP